MTETEPVPATDGVQASLHRRPFIPLPTPRDRHSNHYGCLDCGLPHIVMPWTIGDLQSGNYDLWIHCQGSRDGVRCNRHTKADLEALAARLGSYHGAMAADLMGKFRCTRCDSTISAISIHPPTVRDVRTGMLR